MQWKLHVRITRAGHRNPPAEKLTGHPGPTLHSVVCRVVRSTSVPIAELRTPRIRSPHRVCGHCPVIGLGRSFADEDLGCDEGAAPLAGPRSGEPQRSPASQTCHQLPPQPTSALHIGRLLDGLVRGFAQTSLWGKVHPEAVRYLPRTPKMLPADDQPRRP